MFSSLRRLLSALFSIRPTVRPGSVPRDFGATVVAISRRNCSVVPQSMQVSVTETPYCSLLRSAGSAFKATVRLPSVPFLILRISQLLVNNKPVSYFETNYAYGYSMSGIAFIFLILDRAGRRRKSAGRSPDLPWRIRCIGCRGPTYRISPA